MTENMGSPGVANSCPRNISEHDSGPRGSLLEVVTPVRCQAREASSPRLGDQVLERTQTDIETKRRWKPCRERDV